MTRPLALDLCSGLGGWAEGLEAAGWDVIRVDIADMFAETGTPKPPGCLLMIQDILTFHGAQARHCGLIVASPPCQAYSYMAMPFSRGRDRAAEIRADVTGAKLAELNRLFHACFRIQREASEAAGRHIPMVVENVLGAVPWVGQSKYHAGSMHFWGDVPSLMPEHTHIKAKSFRFDGEGGSFQTATVSRWFNDGPRTPNSLASSGSKSPARKAASARIAKIPEVLSTWIGRVYFPSQIDRQPSRAALALHDER